MLLKVSATTIPDKVFYFLGEAELIFFRLCPYLHALFYLCKYLLVKFLGCLFGLNAPCIRSKLFNIFIRYKYENNRVMDVSSPDVSSPLNYQLFGNGNIGMEVPSRGTQNQLLERQVFPSFLLRNNLIEFTFTFISHSLV